MEIAKKAVARSKKFVSDHKVAIAVIITTYACYKLSEAERSITRKDTRNLLDFLDEHDLYETYKAKYQ